MKKIKIVGVVGAGTMGSALAQKFAQEGFTVILADREMQFVEKGISGIKKTFQEGIEKKIFSAQQVENFIAGIKGTADLNDLSQCDLIIEAIFEDIKAKQELFKTLSNIVNGETIIATNTSSFSVTELAKSIIRPERFIGLHFFYHAAKNRLVEIVPGEKTSDETFNSIKVFSVKAGKDAITTKDSFGFAVNRFFVPWLNEAARLLEEGIAEADLIDQVCMKLFGIGMGPFALMNATGVPIAYHAQKTLEIFGNFYKVSPLLKQQAETGKNWEIRELTGQTINPEIENVIIQRMLGVVFFVCSQILEENVCTASELNRGARIGLRWRKGPIDLMIKSGEKEVKQLAQIIAEKYNEKLPTSITAKNWEIEYVQLEKSGNRAIITMARPEDMNALNEVVMNQLSEKFEKAENDTKIDTIFLIGSGKAFVAGADIKFFTQNIKNNSISNIESFTKFGQNVYKKIDESKKKIIVIINGLTLGGGLELALCADIILAVPKAVVAFPETGIGIYPGLGGTQRTVKKIGKELSKYLIYTGFMMKAKDAEQMGLIDAVIDLDELFEILEGKKEVLHSKKLSETSNNKWNAISKFFEANAISQILNSDVSKVELPEEEVERLRKTIRRKAPLALKISEKLIDEAKGCESELENLNYIFSTSDALLGLSSIGQRVEFQGK